MNRHILLLIGILSATTLFAQGPPITTETPIMLGLEGNGIRTFGKFISKENVNIYVQPIVIPYNITPKFQVGAVFPFKFITPENSKTTGGFADLTVFAKYQLYKIDGKAKTFRILGLVRQTFPTGSTSSNPAIGSGLSQTYVGVVLGKLTTKAGLYGDLGYNITNKNASDNFVYNFSVGVPLLPHKYPQKQLNTYLEFNGNYVFDPKIHTLFISPGLQFIPGRRILFETSLQIPIVQDNNTTNRTNYMVLLGTRFLLN
jgi:hypothetical protein